MRGHHQIVQPEALAGQAPQPGAVVVQARRRGPGSMHRRCDVAGPAPRRAGRTRTERDGPQRPRPPRRRHGTGTGAAANRRRAGPAPAPAGSRPRSGACRCRKPGRSAAGSTIRCRPFPRTIARRRGAAASNAVVNCVRSTRRPSCRKRQPSSRYRVLSATPGRTGPSRAPDPRRSPREPPSRCPRCAARPGAATPGSGRSTFRR